MLLVIRTASTQALFIKKSLDLLITLGAGGTEAVRFAEKETESNFYFKAEMYRLQLSDL